MLTTSSNSSFFMRLTTTEDGDKSVMAYCWLTLFGPAYFDVSGIQGAGGHIVPTLNIFGLGRVRVPILS